MRKQKLSDNHIKEGFSMLENPLVASDLLSSDHVTGYGRHFEKNNSARHKCTF